MFVELGSSIKQWSDLKAAEAVAHSAISAISKFNASNNADAAMLGIGGTHYNKKFTQMALNDEAVFGHMIPKYALAKIDSEILSQCVQRTQEKVSLAFLDWKGIRGEDKQKLLAALQAASLSYRKV
jgi:D-aminoacyl-tRNA deacylase